MSYYNTVYNPSSDMAAEHNRNVAVYWHNRYIEAKQENDRLKSALATMAMQLDETKRQLAYMAYTNTYTNKPVLF